MLKSANIRRQDRVRMPVYSHIDGLPREIFDVRCACLAGLWLMYGKFSFVRYFRYLLASSFLLLRALSCWHAFTVSSDRIDNVFRKFYCFFDFVAEITSALQKIYSFISSLRNPTNKCILVDESTKETCEFGSSDIEGFMFAITTVQLAEYCSIRNWPIVLFYASLVILAVSQQ